MYRQSKGAIKILFVPKGTRKENQRFDAYYIVSQGCILAVARTEADAKLLQDIFLDFRRFYQREIA